MELTSHINGRYKNVRKSGAKTIALDSQEKKKEY
jgi:hypothetical protein